MLKFFFFSFLCDSLLVAFHASVLFSILFIFYESHLRMSPQKQNIASSWYIKYFLFSLWDVWTFFVIILYILVGSGIVRPKAQKVIGLWEITWIWPMYWKECSEGCEPRKMWKPNCPKYCRQRWVSRQINSLGKGKALTYPRHGARVIIVWPPEDVGNHGKLLECTRRVKIFTSALMKGFLSNLCCIECT